MACHWIPLDDRCTWNLHEGSCQTLLQALPDACMDAVITDPPYGTASPGKVQATSSQGGEIRQFDLPWDRELPLDWIPEAARALRPGGAFVAFTDGKRIGELWAAAEAAGLKGRHNLYWRKTNPTLQPRGNFASAVEVALYARKPGGPEFWTGGATTHNVYEAPLCTGPERTAHPTQKPQRLMEWLIGLLVPPDGFVLDPFAGSGTTGAAALKLGRRFMGAERDPEYYRIACARLDRTARDISRKDAAGQIGLFEEDTQC